VTAVDISSAAALLAEVLDVDSFRSWDSPPRQVADAEYRTALARAALRSDADEAIITGEGLLAGRRVAVMCSEFAFMGGSIGTAAAHRIVTAVRRATESRLPLLASAASAASGGTRMQEGAAAFTRMAPIVLALTEHKAAGLPYLVHLRNPTTGGVFASWASLGHITVAEPGALIGFLGPSVFEALNGDLRRSGVVDRLIDERPDAADEPVAFASRPASAITYELAQLCTGPEGRRVDRQHRLRP
jgi:acetyl-CoA carboxylase carboxyl transferase subunit beta